MSDSRLWTFTLSFPWWTKVPRTHSTVKLVCARACTWTHTHTFGPYTQTHIHRHTRPTHTPASAGQMVDGVCCVCVSCTKWPPTSAFGSGCHANSRQLCDIVCLSVRMMLPQTHNTPQRHAAASPSHMALMVQNTPPGVPPRPCRKMCDKPWTLTPGTRPADCNS